MIAREGWPSIVAGGVLALIGYVAEMIWGFWWLKLVWIPLLIATAFVVYFFRDPQRKISESITHRDVLAPADGKIVAIATEEEPVFMKATAQRISIFLSPLNVHVNRIPVTGTIESVAYKPGSYLAAWNPDAGVANEQSQIGLRTEHGQQIFFKQIAGALARRVVFYLDVGDSVRAGDKFGIVKFGSRMDVFLPQGAAISVQLGDKVQAGLTTLAQLEE